MEWELGVATLYPINWASWFAQLIFCLQCRRSQFNSWVRKFSCRRDRLPIPVFLSFPGGSDSKESTCKAGDLRSSPGLGRSPGGGHGNPLQYSYLENPCRQRGLVGYSPWGRTESDTAEWLSAAVTNDVEPVECASWSFVYLLREISTQILSPF